MRAMEAMSTPENHDESSSFWFGDGDGNESSSTLIHVPTPLLFCSMVPLLALAFISWNMGLQLESPIVVGILRTFVQLSILGAILVPIFTYGMYHPLPVLAYVLFMVVLATLESSARSKYYFDGMYPSILAAFLFNTGLVSIFAFGFIIRPSPVWNPQYVIPIIGMLLGNCINGVALAMNAVLSSLVEQSVEIELLLSFGASPMEASARLVQESVRVGAMPMLNSMAVIGLISIPGMMTGQILGGAPVMEAARYQMLICYLIAMCAFGTILSEIWIARWVGFDPQTHMLRTDRLHRREEKLNFLRRIGAAARLLFTSRSTSSPTAGGTATETELLQGTGVVGSYVAPHGTLEIVTMHENTSKTIQQTAPTLELRRVSRSFTVNKRKEPLFQDISVTIRAGDIVAIRGPSGVGKSQLLRLVAGLSPMDEGGDMFLMGESRSQMTTPEQWRRQVRYVTQYKVDIPGTPRTFVQKVASFQSWRHKDMPVFDEMIAITSQTIQSWGLEVASLDKEWKTLSGGEAQRVYVAISIASRPKVLLMDEVTSALDLNSKTRVEQTLEKAASRFGISVLWITHDDDQVARMTAA